MTGITPFYLTAYRDRLVGRSTDAARTPLSRIYRLYKVDSTVVDYKVSPAHSGASLA